VPEGHPLAARRRFGGVWRHPDFLKLWAAGAVSAFGSEVSGLAIPLVAVLTLNAGPIEMGILGAARTSPALLLGLFAGVWVDRLPRRPVLIGCDLARAALLLSIPAAWLFGLLTLAYLSVAAFLIGSCTVFFEVAHASYLPSLLRREDLVEANSKLEISESLTQFAGAGSGGLLIQVLTAPLAIVVDSISFLVSALFVRSIRGREPAAEIHPRRTGVLSEAVEGLRAVLSQPLLRATVAYGATTQLLINAVLAVFVLYVVADLGLQPAVIGLIVMAAAPGTLLGALVAGRVVRRAGLGAAMSTAAVLPGLGVVLFVLASGPLSSVPLLMLGWFLLGLASIYDISEVSLRQAVTPDRIRGRVNATRSFAFFGVMPVGSVLGGVLGAAIGVHPVLLLAAVGLLCASLWIVLTPVGRLSQPPF
jgi:MFS family permease